MKNFQQDGEKYSISKDMSGVCRLAIKNSELEDNGEYTCKIEKQSEKTTATTKIVGEFFKSSYPRPLVNS